jgi:hypothetical protein
MKIIKPKKKRFEIKEECDIKINAMNIKARDIEAWNIDARNIDALGIKAWNIIQVWGTKLKVKKKIKCKVLIVYEDCKITGKVEAEHIVRLKRR